MHGHSPQCSPPKLSSQAGTVLAKMETLADQAGPSELNVPSSNGEVTAPKHSILSDATATDGPKEPPAKKTKVDMSSEANGQPGDGVPRRQKGVAPVKPECVLSNRLTDLAHTKCDALGTLLH